MEIVVEYLYVYSRMCAHMHILICCVLRGNDSNQRQIQRERETKFMVADKPRVIVAALKIACMLIS